LPIGHFDLVFCLVRSPDIAYQNKTAVHNRLFKVAAEATLTIAVDSKHAIEAAARHPACTMLPKSSLPSSNRTPIHGLALTGPLGQSAVDMMDNTKDSPPCPQPHGAGDYPLKSSTNPSLMCFSSIFLFRRPSLW
jgi:hypothetical protein